MRRNELKKLYTVHNRIDPDTGRDKKEVVYIGKRFAFPRAARRALLPVLWGSLLPAAAAFVAGGLLNSPGSRCLWVLPPFLACLLPLFFGLMAAVAITRMGDVITEVDRADGLHAAEGSALGLCVLGALWVLADAVFLCTGGAAGSLGRELGFCLCGAVTFSAGLVLRRALRGVHPEELPSGKLTKP